MFLPFSKKTSTYHLDFYKQAQKDILKKLLVLFDELTKYPFTGTDKPEQLKYNLTGLWSRRINREHRLVYEVGADSVFVHSAKGHYL